MRRANLFLVSILFFGLSVFGQTPAATKTAPAAAPVKPVKFNKIYAEFETTMGTFKAILFHTRTPNTVSNFIGLAEGTKEFVDYKSQMKKKERFYDGTVIHSVIKNFAIQGGDPTGVDAKRAGSGGPGYTIEDELRSDLKHDKPGVLAMSNAGKPNSNGSQFYITLAPTPKLNKTDTIFGQVIKGMDVVEKIGQVKTDRLNDRPIESIVINKINIIRE